MTKIFTLTCPEESCKNEFPYEADPKTIGDGGELIACPKCGEEWEWEFDIKAETLILLPDEVEDDEEYEEITGEMPDDEEFDEEDEDDEDDD